MTRTCSARGESPSEHYDRVTEAWQLIFGDEFHYGVFDRGEEELSSATGRLTELMMEAVRIGAADRLLDVGCGTGKPACRVAAQLGARVVGISTSIRGVAAARRLATEVGLATCVSFELRDGMDNGFPDSSFNRVWALESSHLMRDRARLMSEMARVLAPGGRLALCDIIRKRSITFQEVLQLREPLLLLREVFGDARMEPLSEYRRLAEKNGLIVDREDDLTERTSLTFARWRENAFRGRSRIVALVGEEYWSKFLAACGILERFWADGTLGYGLLAASKPIGTDQSGSETAVNDEHMSRDKARVR